jgi:hypothetical protein
MVFEKIMQLLFPGRGATEDVVAFISQRPLFVTA